MNAAAARLDVGAQPQPRRALRRGRRPAHRRRASPSTSPAPSSRRPAPPASTSSTSSTAPSRSRSAADGGRRRRRTTASITTCRERRPVGPRPSGPRPPQCDADHVLGARRCPCAAPGLFVGAGGVGFSVASGTPRPRDRHAVRRRRRRATAAAGSRSPPRSPAAPSQASTGLTMTVNSLGVEINRRAASTPDARRAAHRRRAKALDWTTAIDLTPGGTFHADPVSITVKTPTGPVTQHDRLHTGEPSARPATPPSTSSGSSPARSASRSRRGRSTSTSSTRRHATGASLTLTLASRSPTSSSASPAASASGHRAAALEIAALKPAAASTDHRSWLALTADLTGGSFVGVDGLTLTISSLHVELNQGQTAARARLRRSNWTTALRRSP